MLLSQGLPAVSMSPKDPPATRTVYAELLSKRGHGTALWDPDPVRDETLEEGNPEIWDVAIGDVGILDEKGGFTSYFNVIQSKDGPKNKDGLPDNFEPLSFHRKLRISKKDYLDPGPIYYNTEVADGAGVSVAGGV